jgi:hypothetical protein
VVILAQQWLGMVMPLTYIHVVRLVQIQCTSAFGSVLDLYSISHYSMAGSMAFIAVIVAVIRKRRREKISQPRIVPST